MSDHLSNVAFNARAPASERFDAQAELSGIYMPTSSGIVPAADVKEAVRYILERQEEEDFLKGAAALDDTPRGTGKREAKSVYLDDMGIFKSEGYYEKPSPLGFDGLRQLVTQVPLLSAIILKRTRQISRFCQPSNDGGPGFEIRHVEHGHELQSDEEESVKLLTKFMLNCGWEFNPRRRKALRRDNFKSFMTKLYSDSLTMDASPIETVMKSDPSLGIDGLYAVDGATIRLCTEAGYDGDDAIFALQVVEGRLTTSYTPESLIYEVRNPRTDVRLAGYGMSEVELLIRVVTGFLNALTYNINGFDRNSIPKGLLTVFGDYDQADQQAFKRIWNSWVKGVNNAWALPVMFSRDQGAQAKFEKFGVEFTDLYFSKFMTFVASLSAALFGMDPTEINFESFSASTSSSLSGDDTEERLTSAKDSGLRSDMGHFESVLSDYVLSAFTEKYCFRWVGLDRESPQAIDEKKKLVQTVNEMRAEIGQKPHEDDKIGKAPVNPALMQIYMQGIAPQGGEFGAQQPEQDFGGPAQPGDEDHPDAAGGPDGGDGGDAPPGADASGDQPPPEPKPAGEFGSSGPPASPGDGQEAFAKAQTSIYAVTP